MYFKKALLNSSTLLMYVSSNWHIVVNQVKCTYRAGSYISMLTFVYDQVCRVLRGYYQAASLAVAHPVIVSNGQDHAEVEKRDARQGLKEARMHVEEALGASLLPALQLLPANPAVGLAIWDVMSLLPYEVSTNLSNRIQQHAWRLAHFRL